MFAVIKLRKLENSGEKDLYFVKKATAVGQKLQSRRYERAFQNVRTLGGKRLIASQNLCRVYYVTTK